MDSTKVVLSPTWSQSFQFASERGDYIIWLIIGIVCLSLALITIVGAATNAKWFPKIGINSNVLLFVFLVAGVTSLVGNAGRIKFNNDKVLSKEHVEKVIQDAGSVKPIWDSLRNNCLIIDGPYDCYNN